jgi:hypothetical protein
LLGGGGALAADVVEVLDVVDVDVEDAVAVGGDAAGLGTVVIRTSWIR